MLSLPVPESPLTNDNNSRQQMEGRVWGAVLVFVVAYLLVKVRHRRQ